MSWLHAAATRFRLFFAARASEQRIDAELEFHIEMETERLVRELGIDASEARRRALVTFGGKEQHREALRDGRGTAWLGALSLDVKLGLRMLAKYPGLTFVGVLGVSVAVAGGARAFIAALALQASTLPLDEGDRVVAIGNHDVGRNVDVKATHLHSLGVWRSALRAVDDLGDYRLAQRNVIPPGRSPSSLVVAEMTASAFRLARVSPIRGRYFTDEDEREGAPDVAVIGEDAWRRLFDQRADVVGSILHLGTTRYTIIGVMPTGFAFPVNNELWTPLRLSTSAYPRGEAPPINVVGRLAPGASLDDARRELTTVAPRVAELVPRGEFIRPIVMPYTRAFLSGTIGGMGYGSLAQRAQVIVILLLIVITTNVAVLVYARTASRAGEMALRTALGASRSRIVAQLFVEALVLSGVASVVGLAIVYLACQRVSAMLQVALGPVLPYWIRLEVTPGVALYAAGLAMFAAMLIGAIPGLKATRHHLAQSLKDVSGNASMRLGRTWTALLVAQVAISVAILPIAQGGTRAWLALVFVDLASPVTSHTVIATPLLDDNVNTFSLSDDVRRMRRARYGLRVAELEQRLEADAGADVVLMSSAPGDEGDMRIELNRLSQSPDTLAWQSGASVLVSRVGAGFFEAFDIRLLAGRMFDGADAGAGVSPIIVNRAFVERFFGGGSALGRRVRRSPEVRIVNGVREESSEPWREIVGVVDDFPRIVTHTVAPRIYLPLRVAETFPITLAVHAPGLAPSIVAERVRSVALAVDPTLRFGPIRSLEDRLEDGIKAERLGILGIVVVTLSVVLLSTAGMYALMSFTVTRRRREIGIRTALGAGRGRVLAGILSLAMRQIGAGVAIGVVAAPIIAHLAGDTSTPKELIVNGFGLVGAMMVVGLLAAMGPARRALGVHPTEALRAE